MTAMEGSHGYDYVVPQIDWRSALTDEVRHAIDDFFSGVDRSIVSMNESIRARQKMAQAQGKKVWFGQEIPPLGDETRQRLLDYLAEAEPAASIGTQLQFNYQQTRDPWLKLAAADGMNVVALVKICEFLYRVEGNQEGLTHALMNGINVYRKKFSGPTLLELSQMVSVLSARPSDVLLAYCGLHDFAVDWPAEDVWPFFAHHGAVLDKALREAKNGYFFVRAKLFQAIALLPWPQEDIVDALFDVALAGPKTERPEAQAALANQPQKEARIVAVLSSSKADVRTAAAKWLQELGYQDAIPALEAAVTKEKHDLAKGAMLDALQRFGQPVEKYLDREALKKEAAKTLAKGLPKEIDWFPWDAMPAVRWADSGNQVDADVLRLLLVQAVKQKTAEPNAVLRKFCGMFEPRDREHFGQFVLEAWIHEDTSPVSAEVAEQNARSQAAGTHSFMQRQPQYYQNDPRLGMSLEQLYAFYLPRCSRQVIGSATASKGVLAVAAACAAERAAGTAGRFLKEYYGMRAAQCRALVVMLAWIEHPSATQLMLAVGNRFRTKSIQEEATLQAQAMAERKGWTLAELADRTMPSGGFDESGTLELPYGDRSFTATLLPDFKIELHNAEGKKIAALPEPRMDDDADMAKASKQALAAAKKEVKTIVTLQSERLYEALCTERTWTFADWETYLNRHAIVRRLIQRLVWAQVEDGKVVQTFRPLDDGTLTDIEDNEVCLAADACVRLAHDSILPPDLLEAWRTHLADYDIAPLFQQLGKGTYALPPGHANDESIVDFRGWMLEAFALRNRATKLGYARGSTADGGWFFTYEKRFTSLGIVAVIEFTGNGLPEENRSVALLSLDFRGTEDRGSRGIILGNVPKVLLSECYNDLRLMAASGTGFDAEWESRSST